MDVSIIIVNYKVREKLIKCMESIKKSAPKISYEIIIVDNESDDKLRDELKKIKNTVYIKSNNNLGYGGGNNLGALRAKGKYLFFINPDTLVFKDTINSLYEFLEKNKNAGIVSPLLIDKDNKPFVLQGTGVLTPARALIVLSFLNKVFPNNPVSKKYWLRDWDHKALRELEVCPGTALMVRADLFNQIGGFDKEFFLYFEEDDLSKKVRESGFKIFILPKSKIFHEIGQSTKQFSDRDKIFVQSRFRYFRKHYGLLKAIGVESFLGINKSTFLVVAALALAFFLRFYNISQGMTFIGDQGWFYLSARDLLIHGTIPLVGITSSHTWLHQGPLWTYMLSVVLLLFKFNPVSGAYLTALFGVLATFLMYRLGREMFSVRIGIIAALFYAVSPLIISFDRMPFDPSPIPFFTIIYLYALYKWVTGNVKYFPVILLALAILYNLELATFTLVFPFVLILAFGIFKKKKWIQDLANKKIIFFSFILPLFMMSPVIIYDFSHGFKQTVVFLGWTVYKPFSFLIKHNNQGGLLSNINVMITFALSSIQNLVFKWNAILAFIVFTFSLCSLVWIALKTRKIGKILLTILLAVSLAGIIANQTPSDAYLPIIFPFAIFAIAVFFDYLLNFKFLKYFSAFLLMTVLLVNLSLALNQDRTTQFKNRMSAVNKIIALSGGQEYNLVGQGRGSEFRSFTMNYEYLLWWKGHPVSGRVVKNKIVVSESSSGIIVRK
jgi:GT2 family glycosyltransferase